MTAAATLTPLVSQAAEPNPEGGPVEHAPLTRQNRPATAATDDRGDIRRHQGAGALHAAHKLHPALPLRFPSRRCHAGLRETKRPGAHSCCCSSAAFCELCP
jgi:hypothetical protein